jgi:hypothetical protein
MFKYDVLCLALSPLAEAHGHVHPPHEPTSPIIRVCDRKWIVGKGGEIVSSIPKLPAWSLRKDLATFPLLNTSPHH